MTKEQLFFTPLSAHAILLVKVFVLRGEHALVECPPTHQTSAEPVSGLREMTKMDSGSLRRHVSGVYAACETKLGDSVIGAF